MSWLVNVLCANSGSRQFELGPVPSRNANGNHHLRQVFKALIRQEIAYFDVQTTGVPFQPNGTCRS